MQRTTPTPRATKDTLAGMDEQQIGALVRSTRMARALSYRDLAERCGLDRSSTAVIRKIEDGEAYKLSTLATVCKALDLEIVVRPLRKK